MGNYDGDDGAVPGGGGGGCAKTSGNPGAGGNGKVIVKVYG